MKFVSIIGGVRSTGVAWVYHVLLLRKVCLGGLGLSEKLGSLPDLLVGIWEAGLSLCKLLIIFTWPCISVLFEDQAGRNMFISPATP